jgi:hypothetical protein
MILGGGVVFQNTIKATIKGVIGKERRTLNLTVLKALASCKNGGERDHHAECLRTYTLSVMKVARHTVRPSVG